MLFSPPHVPPRLSHSSFSPLKLTDPLAHADLSFPPQLQVQEGIDAVIVDSVLAIRKGLTGEDDHLASAKPPPPPPMPAAMNGNGTINTNGSRNGAVA